MLHILLIGAVAALIIFAIVGTIFVSGFFLSKFMDRLFGL